jgi:hypothetical protein
MSTDHQQKDDSGLLPRQKAARGAVAQACPPRAGVARRQSTGTPHKRLPASASRRAAGPVFPAQPGNPVPDRAATCRVRPRPPGPRGA